MTAPYTLLAIALSAVLVWQWRDWPPAAPTPSANGPEDSADEAFSSAAENPFNLLAPLGEKDEYLGITERPLFLSDRRPPSEEPAEDAAAEPEAISELGHMDLNAVMITPSESLAWIRDPANKELVRLRPGDNLAGWSVQEILSDRVLLERQGEKDTLVLRDYTNAPPVSPPSPPSAPRRRQAETTRPPLAPSRQQPDRRRVDRSPEGAPPRPQMRNPRAKENARQPRRQR